MERMLTTLGLTLGSLFSGCSAAGVLNALVPSSGYVATLDLAYGDHPRQRLDVYCPRPPTEPSAVVVFFYGGSWQSGERGDFRFIGEALTSRGFVTVVPDYRVYPAGEFPAFVEDGARAVAWAREHAARFGGDPERILLMGHSAGAHIAMMLLFDPRYLAGLRIRGAVGLAGPYDFLPFRSRTIRALFGPEPGWPATQPINFVDGDEPPVLLIAGGRDHTVSPGNSSRLAARIREKGGSVEEIVYPRLGHLGVLAALAKPLRAWAPVLRDVVAFLRARDAPEETN